MCFHENMSIFTEQKERKKQQNPWNLLSICSCLEIKTLFDCNFDNTKIFIVKIEFYHEQMNILTFSFIN